MMRFRARQPFLNPVLAIVAAGLLLLAGCGGAGGGGDGGSSTRVTVTVGSESASRGAVARSAALVPSTIRSIRISVRGAGMDDLVEEASVAAGRPATVTLSVPSGPGRTFDAQALDENGVVRYEGSTKADVLGEQLDLAIQLGFSASNPSLGHWRFLNPTPTAQDLYGVAYGNGTFVAVGASGALLSSADGGVTWTTRFAGTTENLVGVAFGNGSFVAVGDAGGIFSSADNGATWAAHATAIDGGGFAVTFGGGRFLALGSGPTILTCDDGGRTWTSRTPTGLPPSAQPSAATYGGGTFYALFDVFGEGSSTELYRSADGSAWVSESLFPPYGSKGLAYGAGSVLVATINGQVLRPGFDPSLLNEGGLYGAAFGDGAFAVVGGAGFLATASDPSSSNAWSYRGADTGATLRGCAVGGGIVVAVGDGGMIVTSGTESTDVRWSSQFATDLGPVGFGGGVFVADAGGGAILRSSTDGATWLSWVRSPPPPPGSPPVAGAPVVGPLSGFAYGGGAFVAVGPLSLKQTVTPVPENETPTLYVSTDGAATWAYAPGAITESLTAVTFGSATFMATSASDGVYWCQPPASPLEKWTWSRVSVTAPSNAGVQLAAVTFGGGVFVAAGTAGSSGAVFRSSDLGQTWTAARGSFPLGIRLLAHADGVFVAVDDGGSAYTSIDGAAWSAAGTLPLNDSLLSGISYGGGVFVVTDTSGYLYVSADDATTWSQIPFRSAHGLSSVTFGNGAFLAGGQQGTILRSDAL